MKPVGLSGRSSHDVGFRRLRRKTQARGSLLLRRPVDSATSAPPTTQAAPAPVVDEYNRLKAMPRTRSTAWACSEDPLRLEGETLGARAIARAPARTAEVLKKFDFLKVTLEGPLRRARHVEYNLALGERRAKGRLRLRRLAGSEATV